MKNLELKKMSEKRDSGVCKGTIVEYQIFADGVHVGDIRMMELDDDGWIHCDSIEIFEPYRNQGLGTKALETLGDIYGSYTITPDNEDSRRLYDRLGTEELSWRDAYYTDQGYGVYEI